MSNAVLKQSKDDWSTTLDQKHSEQRKKVTRTDSNNIILYTDHILQRSAAASWASSPEDVNLSFGFENIRTQKIASIKNEIRRYATLKDGWDGPSSLAPLPAAANLALSFLDRITPDTALPKTMLERDGEIAIYWDHSPKYLEIGFRGQHEISYYGEDETSGFEISGDDPFDGHHIPNKLIEFMRKF